MCFIINCLMQFVYFNSMHWFIFVIFNFILTKTDLKMRKSGSVVNFYLLGSIYIIFFRKFHQIVPKKICDKTNKQTHRQYRSRSFFRSEVSATILTRARHVDRTGPSTTPKRSDLGMVWKSDELSYDRCVVF